MKLSRNVLVGSLATTGMVLGAIAPALTAQAATTSATVDDNDNVTAVTPNQDIGALEGNKNLAIALDGKTATAESNASVKVVSGMLILDRVPDFNFGAAASGTVKGLQDNTRDDKATAVDGNSEGVLQVTESRDKLPGFNLTASLGQFKDANGDTVTGTGAKPDFILHLMSQGLTINNKDQDVLKTTDQSLTAGDATGKDVMSATNGQAGYTTGTLAATFDSSKAAELTVASGIGDGSTPSVKSLNSTITWTLNAKADASAGAGTGE